MVPLGHKEAGVFIHQLLPRTGWGHSWSIKSLVLPACHAATPRNWAPSQDQRPPLGKKTEEAVSVQAVSRVRGQRWTGPPQCLLHCAKDSLGSISVHLHSESVVLVHVATISISQRRELRLREFRQHAPSHPVGAGQHTSNFYTKLPLRGPERVSDLPEATQ